MGQEDRSRVARYAPAFRPQTPAIACAGFRFARRRASQSANAHRDGPRRLYAITYACPIWSALATLPLPPRLGDPAPTAIGTISEPVPQGRHGTPHDDLRFAS